MKKSHLIEITIFLILILILAIFGIKLFKNTFDIGKTYTVSFQDINGIEVGSPVRILGVDIGHVTKIDNDFDTIDIDFVISNPKVKIPDGTKATIASFGIAGSRSLELTPPTGNTYTKGIVIEEPYRLGDAFEIMEKFMEAAMASVSGLYEFAKGKSQNDVSDITNKFLITTNSADDKVEAFTSKIEKGGAKLHESFVGTTKGMTRTTNEIENLNISQNYNKGRYVVNLSKRILLKAHRKLTAFNENSEIYAQSAISILKKAATFSEKIKKIDKLFTALDDMDETVKKLEENAGKENLEKFSQTIKDAKEATENLNKNF